MSYEQLNARQMRLLVRMLEDEESGKVLHGEWHVIPVAGSSEPTRWQLTDESRRIATTLRAAGVRPYRLEGDDAAQTG